MLTVKESIENGRRVYSLALEIEKRSPSKGGTLDVKHTTAGEHLTNNSVNDSPVFVNGPVNGQAQAAQYCLALKEKRE